MKKILCIIAGNALIAIAISTLILDNDIIAGGVSGIGIVLQHYLGISVSLSVGIINVILFLTGLLFIGKAFAAKTLISTFLFPVFLQVFGEIPTLHGYLDDPLLAAVIAGCLIGLGLGLILKSGASTGGVDIIGVLLNKKFKISLHHSLNTIDFIILILQITFHDTTSVIYGITAVIITYMVMNYTLTRGTGLVQVMVMSDNFEAIRNMILKEQNAGATLLYCRGAYTDRDSEIVMSVVPYRKLPSMKEAILKIDPAAFIIVSHIQETSGNGFTYDIRESE